MAEVYKKLLTEGDDLSLATAIDVTMLYEVTKKQSASVAAKEAGKRANRILQAIELL